MVRRTTYAMLLGALWAVLCSVHAFAATPTEPRPTSSPASQIVVLAHRDLPFQKLNVTELRDLFLKVRPLLDDGTKVVPINARDGSPLRAEFQRRVIRMRREEEGRYWEDQKIREGQSKPAEFGDSLRAVYSIPASIGYIFYEDYLALPPIVRATLRVVATIAAK